MSRKHLRGRSAVQSGELKRQGVADVVRAWLGWCPSAPMVTSRIPETSDLPCSGGIPARDMPPAGRIQIVPVVIPHWMTAVSLVILFATCFVGGNFWWPLMVLAVIGVFTLCLCRSCQASREV